ncbi:collagen alpha-1(I) chain-like [Manis pentadactyla]|uniref:collagen alpha-1(I) chain-like n=1 Tax=Manis pentadactyla TaxID=143292 RepID=UPI00255C3271|nr:collagen alpha-1(I) chain-like [Manis pentadactyla]
MTSRGVESLGSWDLGKAQCGQGLCCLAWAELTGKALCQPTLFHQLVSEAPPLVVVRVIVAEEDRDGSPFLSALSSRVLSTPSATSSRLFLQMLSSCSGAQWVQGWGAVGRCRDAVGPPLRPRRARKREEDGGEKRRPRGAPLPTPPTAPPSQRRRGAPDAAWRAGGDRPPGLLCAHGPHLSRGAGIRCAGTRPGGGPCDAPSPQGPQGGAAGLPSGGRPGTRSQRSPIPRRGGSEAAGGADPPVGGTPGAEAPCSRRAARTWLRTLSHSARAAALRLHTRPANASPDGRETCASAPSRPRSPIPAPAGGGVRTRAQRAARGRSGAAVAGGRGAWRPRQRGRKARRGDPVGAGGRRRPTRRSPAADPTWIFSQLRPTVAETAERTVLTAQAPVAAQTVSSCVPGGTRNCQDPGLDT